MTISTTQILRCTAVTQKLGIAKSTLYDWLNPKSPRYDVSFPKPFKIGLASVGWLEAEIDAWINVRIQTGR
jgi:prophage regulatory protein